MKLSLLAKGSAVQRIQLKPSYFYYMTPHSDPDLEVSIPIFLHELDHHTKCGYKRSSRLEDTAQEKNSLMF